ncbi:MAG: MarR family transcriptional regulator [Flavobacteriaceae bacterium]|nr:MarR family transcriptional regulator [Bacteroidota bacterium]MDT8413942.1 MarR family transcriptional regulator [Flavobacteriaceae bacterium]
MKDKTIDYALRVAWQAIVKFYNEEASKVDMTMAMGFALLSIDPIKGTPSTALGPKMGLEATSLSRTLKIMEEKGLIVRSRNPDDGRSVLIGLTPLGVKKREASKEVVLHFNDVVKNTLTERKLNHFYEVIETIIQLVQNKKVYLTELKSYDLEKTT